ncbi:hypothetical protein P3G55_00790 [Leptospira sp. 96542]|nr:hypothetical protein [Leptospira sp. 96542]
MYEIILKIHSLVRYLVILGFVLSLVTHLFGILQGRKIHKLDWFFPQALSGFLKLQVVVGFTLYFLYSPYVKMLFHGHWNVHYEVWFFGLLHMSVMFVSVGIVDFGISKAKQRSDSKRIFKTLFVFELIGFIIVCSVIPWFRPLFRFLEV